jgi:hypothetical protein
MPMTLVLRFCVIWLVFVLWPLAWLAQSGISFNETIAPTAIRSDGGFIFAVPVHAPPLFEAWPDSVSAPTASTLRLLEDGKELGPAHTSHAVIGSKGHGSFSHWSTNLHFSSSDGTDPRTNGRQYFAAFPIFPATQAVLIVILGPIIFFAIAKMSYDACSLLPLPSKGKIILAGILLLTVSMIIAFTAATAGWSLIVQDQGPIPLRLYVVLGIVPFALLFGRELVTRSELKSGRVVSASTFSLATIGYSVLEFRSLSRLGGLTILYTVTFALVYCSLSAQKSATGAVKINFEYRIF